MGGLIIAVTQDVDWGGPLTWFFSAIVFGWLFLVLVSVSFWLFQLSRFEGPLITIGTEGITDHFNNDDFLEWGEICLIDWKRAYHKGVGVVLFRVIPNKRSIKYTMLSLFGRGRLQYPEQYLSVQASEITQFILKAAPAGILK